MKVYAFNYCPCIHESSFATISVHKTRKGAEIAMSHHKQKALEEFKDMYSIFDFKFGEYERWEVEEIEILD